MVKHKYFIPLLIGNVSFLNTTGNPVNRYTCTIPGDPFLLSTANPSGVGGPCGLLPLALGSTECAIDEINKWQQLQFKVASAAQDSIYHKLHEHLAPGFSATAFGTCEKITMAFQDKDGNSVSLIVFEYYNALLQGALRQLQKYLLIDTCCEKKLSQTKDFVKKTIGDTHSFMSKVMSDMGMDIPEDASDGPTFLSAADKTLQQYKDSRRHIDGKLLPPTDKCWGCKGPHRYRNKHTKGIICPNKDACGVAKCAARMHKVCLEAIHSRCKGWVPKDKVKFSQLSPSQKEAGRQYFLRQAQELSPSTPTSASAVSSLSSAPTHSHGRAYVVLPILHSTDTRHDCKPILPVQIDGQLPRITLVLGTMDSALKNCPMIRCLFDTGACLSSGYAGFWLPILRAHPECIADLFTSDNGDYTPIILGGVVTRNDGDMSRHTTQLNVVVRLKLRYETTTHQPITHTIAIGSHVSVNTIFGKTFMKSLHCHYDATSSVVEAKLLLNVAPFPVMDMFPQHYDCTDKVSPSSGRPAKNYSSIVSILDHIKKTMLTSVVPVTPQYARVDHNSLIRNRQHNKIGPDDSSTGYSTYLSDITDVIDRQNQIIALIKCKLDVFRPEEMSIPVLDYKFNINTGTAPPVWSKVVNFGPRESEIMQPMIDKLESINQICQPKEMPSLQFPRTGTTLLSPNLTSFTIGHNHASSETLRAFLGSACSIPVISHGSRSRTDFAQVEMGYVGCQPDNDGVSLAAMHREVTSGPCKFLTNAKDVGSPPRLKPICMGSRRNKGYETRLDSYLGEAFTLDWAINTNRLYTWGQLFTAIKDCYSLKFVLTYKGNNSVILRVQMRLQLWAMDIVHCKCDFNVDSDYMSKLAHSTTFDPLLSRYLQSAAELRSKYPPPDGDMTPETMPGYRKPRKSTIASPPDIDCIPSVTVDGAPIDAETQHVHSLFHSISAQ
ncbi:hypothetical protein HJC23_012747 [Cyclotella cryptica]|uniref:Peptidase A2 domain-containing protein n=1 Tax=Cyclotella cryptica TaxID=29204 RepID=A0ABD3P759_9STRA